MNIQVSNLAQASAEDIALVHAVEREIGARQAAEDSAWAMRAMIALLDDGDEFVGPEATMEALKGLIARAEAAEGGLG